jgi:hypothetical protein
MKQIPCLLIGAALVAGCSNTPDRNPGAEVVRVETKQERVTRDLTLSWDNMGRGGAALRQPAYVHVLGHGNVAAARSEAVLPTGGDRPYSEEDALEAVNQIDSAGRAAGGAAGKAVGKAAANAASGSESTNGHADTTGVKPNGSSENEPSSVGSEGSSPRPSSGNKATGHGRTGYSLYELARWERFCEGGAGMDEADWLFVTKQGGAGNVPSTLDTCTAPNYDYQDYLAAWTGFCTNSDITSAQRNIVRHSVRPSSRVNPCEALNK